MTSPMELLGWIIIGAVAGWLASRFTQVSSRALWVDILIGITGAVVGGQLFYPALASTIPNIWSLWTAFTGSVLLLCIFRLVRFAIGSRATKGSL